MSSTRTDFRKQSAERARKPSVAESLWDNVKQIGIAVVLALIIKTSVVEAYKIPTSSMEDTLLVGDFLLAIDGGGHRPLHVGLA